MWLGPALAISPRRTEGDIANARVSNILGTPLSGRWCNKSLFEKMEALKLFGDPLVSGFLFTDPRIIANCSQLEGGGQNGDSAASDGLQDEC